MDLKAVSPEEIALSILAEMVSAKHGMVRVSEQVTVVRV